MRVRPDGSFSDHIRPVGGREVVVRATTPDGAVTELTRTLARR